ncbi:Cro/Cl family transcriptional regulator [Enterobacteriaceae bacterium ML5]|nr:Cro/Cl family transcriptional regulator [Enterobacteriaceae bacterium ML5]
MKPVIKTKITGLATKSEIARRIGVKPQAVHQWMLKHIPPYQVIPFCAALEWSVTPHQVDPVLYPNPNDGLPAELHGSSAAA